MNLLVRNAPMPPVTEEQNQWFEELCGKVAQLPPVEIKTEHHLHAGMYSRTIYVPAGAAVVGTLIKCPTQLIAHGHFQITDGGVTQEFNGFHVFDGNAGRRAAVVAFSDSAFTMVFPSNAKTVEEAESEFTDEPERLLSRNEKLAIGD